MREFRMLFAGLFAGLLLLEVILLVIAVRDRAMREVSMADQRLLLQAREAIDTELESIVQLSDRAQKAATIGDMQLAKAHEDLLATVGKRTTVTAAPQLDASDVAAHLQGLQGGETVFKGEDFAPLKQSLTDAETILQSDRRALHALRGLFPDADGKFTIRGDSDPSLSLALLTDEPSTRMRVNIQRNLSDFLAALDVRIYASVEANTDAIGRYSKILSAMIGVLLIATAAVGIVLYRNISEPLQSFRIHSRKINADLARTLAQLDAVSAERNALRKDAGASAPVEEPVSDERFNRMP